MASNASDNSDVRNRVTTGFLNLVQPPIPKTKLKRNFISNRVVYNWNRFADQTFTSVVSVPSNRGCRGGYGQLHCEKDLSDERLDTPVMGVVYTLVELNYLWLY